MNKKYNSTCALLACGLLFFCFEVDIMVPGKHTVMLVKHITYQLQVPTKGLLR